jgi:hypothetical protein
LPKPVGFGSVVVDLTAWAIGGRLYNGVRVPSSTLTRVGLAGVISLNLCHITVYGSRPPGGLTWEGGGEEVKPERKNAFVFDVGTCSAIEVDEPFFPQWSRRERP